MSDIHVKLNQVVTLLLISILLFLLIVFLLFTPIRLVIDSEEKKCQIAWWGLGSARVVATPGDLVVRTKALFWQKDFYPLHRDDEKEEKVKKSKIKKADRIKSWRKYFRRGRNIFKSFRIKRWLIDFDTDDFVLNSQLYPICCLLSGRRTPIRVNYKGEVKIIVEIENRLWRVLGAMLR